MKKRILSLLLVALLLIGMIPVSALAAEEHGISVSASAPATAETTQGGQYTLNMSDVFTDSEGHNMTYTLSGGDFGEHTKIASGDNGYFLNFTNSSVGTYNVTITAVCENDAAVTASHTIAITVKEAEAGDPGQYGYDETPQKSVKVYVTISNDGVPIVGNEGTTLAHLEINVPYFDLGLYDLSQFYRYETENGQGSYINDTIVERPTLLHLYIYMLGVYYVGCSPEDIISGAAKDSIIGADGGYGVFDMTGEAAYEDNLRVLNITGSATSLYMQQFWGHDENLMYYRNHVYPLMSAGWGSTADYILLSDNDTVDLAMFSNWSFWSDGGAFARFDKDDYTVEAGTELTVKTLKYDTKAVADGGTESFDPITGLNVSVYDEAMRLVGTANPVSEDGNEYTYTFDKAGTYYILGLDPNMGTDDARKAPANSKVVVTGGETPVEPDYVLRTLTFEDADYKGGMNFAGKSDWSSLIDDPQYGGSMLYPNGSGTTNEDEAYTWYDAGNTELTHTLPKSWDNYCYWGGGHAVSNYVSGDFTTYGNFNNQLTVYKKDVTGIERTGGGHNGSNNFAVHFGYKDNSGYTDSQILPSFAFKDGVARVVDHMYINNICYALNCYLNGNDLTAKIDDTDWVKLTAYGYDAEGKATGSAEIYLCNGPQNIITDWTKFDLSGLGKVIKIEFNITGSSDNGYGFSQPAYFAYDDVAVRFEKSSEPEVCDHSTTEESYAAHTPVDGSFDVITTCTKCNEVISTDKHLYGDVNGDGEVDVTDAMAITTYVNGKVEPTALQRFAADVNADGEISKPDYLLVVQRYLGNVSVLPTSTVTVKTPVGDGTHTIEYKLEDGTVLDSETADCVDANEDGKCDVCGGDMPGCAHGTTEESYAAHTPVDGSFDVITTCTLCNEVVSTEKHLYGDINGDGEINTADAAFIFAFANGKREPTAIQKFAADVNNDGEITKLDGQIVYAYVNGTVTLMPVVTVLVKTPVGDGTHTLEYKLEDGTVIDSATESCVDEDEDGNCDICGGDLRDYVLRVLTFEDEDYKGGRNYVGSRDWSSLIDDPQYNGSLLYPGSTQLAKAYKWRDAHNTMLAHIQCKSGNTYDYFIGGHAISNYVSGDYKTYGGYQNQLTVYKEGVTGLQRTGGGHNGSNNFAIHYGFRDEDGMYSNRELPALYFTDGVARVIDHMYVTTTCRNLLSFIDGSDETKKVGANDYVKIVATGYDAEGNVTGTSEFYLCQGPDNIVKDWTKWDLSGLGEVVKVSFNRVCSQTNSWGSCQPAYFAYDDVAVRFPKSYVEDESAKFEINGVTYESLQAAVDAVKDGETILALNDVSGDGVVVPSGKNFTIDFDGYEYDVSGNLVGSAGTETCGFQLLKDSNIVMKNGFLTSTKAKILVQNYSNLTLIDMNIDVSGATGDCGQYALSNNCGDVNITGATSITAKEGGVAFDVCCFAKYPQVNVTVDTTGTITGTIEFSKSSGRTDEANSSLTIKNINHVGGFSAEEGTEIPVSITGGTYSQKVPTNYCAPGYAPQENSNGTYTVKQFVPRLKAGVSPTKEDQAQIGKAYLLSELQNGKIFETATGGTIKYTQVYYERSTDGGQTWSTRVPFSDALFGMTTIHVMENEPGTYMYRFWASDDDGAHFSNDTWTLTLEFVETLYFNFTAYVSRDYNYSSNGNVYPIIKIYPSLGVDENNQPIPDYDKPIAMLYNNFTDTLPDGAEEYDPAKGTVVSNYNMFYFKAPYGMYCYEAYGWSAEDNDYTVKLGGMQIELPTDQNVDGLTGGGTNLYFQCNSYYASNKKADGTYVGKDDYYIRLDCPIMKCTATMGDPYVVNGYTYYPVMLYAGGNSCLYNYYSWPKTDDYVFKRVGNATYQPSYSAKNTKIDMTAAAFVTVNVPEDTEFGLYYQWNNFNSTEIEPVGEPSIKEGIKSYTYKIGSNDGNYTWRLSKEGYVTRSGWLSGTTGNDTVYSFDFDGASTDILTHDFSKLGSTVIRRDEADLMVSLDPSGFRTLTGETRLRAYRHWEIINSDAGNIMIEPDFHWAVIDGDATFNEVNGGNSTGNWADVTPGTQDSILTVRYDAIEVSPGSYGSHGGLFPAVNPERIGVMVVGGTGVQHGSAAADVDFNMAPGATTTRSMDWDYNYDTWFFDSKDTAPTLDFAVKAKDGVEVSYKFVTADNDMNISLSEDWMAVNAGEDGRYVIDLNPMNSLGNGMGGTVIIRMEDETGVSYRLVRVAKSTVTAVNATNEGEPFMPGDKVSLTFDGLYRAVNKISGIFNPTTFKLRYTSNGTEVEGTVGQYQQMDTAAITLTIPEDIEFPEGADSTEYSFTNGYIYGSMYSAANPFAFLYNMTDSGVGTNFNAVTVTFYISRFADVVIPVQKTVSYNVTFAAADSASGESISGAKIVVKDVDGNAVEANEDGTYTLKVGTYTYEILADGYKALRDTLVLSVNTENDNGNVTVASKLEFAGEGAWDGETATKPQQDENGVYLISNAAELAWFAGAVNGTLTDEAGEAIAATPEISGKVIADIELAGRSWTPIGSINNKYTGTFDGGSHTISGLYVHASTGGYLGLFGSTNTATIKDFTLNGEVSLIGGRLSNAYVGGVVGYAMATTISGITSNVNVTVTCTAGNASYTGGLVGSISGESSITDCVNNGSVTGKNYTGGIAGSSTGKSSSTELVKNCVNNGVITSTGSTVGGIVGNASKVGVWYCTNNASVTGGSEVGGITGAAAYALIQQCVNNASVTGTSSYAGGITGKASSSTTVMECTNKGDISCYNAAGIVGNASGGAISRCVNSGAVTGQTSAAGIVGNTGSNTAIEECANFGTVTSTGENSYAGGIVFYGYQRGTVTNCYNAGAVISAGYAGGIVGETFASTADNYKITNCYNVGELSGKYAGGIVGLEYTYNEKYSTDVSNSYYLDSVENAIGAERNGYYTLTDVKAVTSDEMKAMAPTLGEAYETNKSIYNNGYPVLVWQEIEQPVAAEVDFTAQALGGFLCAPQTGVEVSSDLAESYGYKDDVPYGEGVSALDVLVKAHEIIFEDAFTAETKDEFLVVRSTGTISTIFGTVTGNCGFTVNGMCPVDPDSTKDDYGYYSGYMITQAKILDGDALEFFIYQDGYAMDNYLLFTDGTEYGNAFTVEQDKNLKLTAMGYSIGWYGTQCKTFEEVQAKLAAISDAQLAIVDTATGAMTDITDAITGEDGTFTLKFDKTGTYVITAYMPAAEIEENYATPVIMTLATITVTEKTTITGDANGDGIVDATDAVLILRYYADAKAAEGINLAAADVDGNGIIDANDAVAVLRIYAGA